MNDEYTRKEYVELHHGMIRELNSMLAINAFRMLAVSPIIWLLRSHSTSNLARLSLLLFAAFVAVALWQVASLARCVVHNHKVLKHWEEQ